MTILTAVLILAKVCPLKGCSNPPFDPIEYHFRGMTLIPSLVHAIDTYGNFYLTSGEMNRPSSEIRRSS